MKLSALLGPVMALAVVLAASDATARTQEAQAWTAHVNGTECFNYSFPQDSRGGPVNRGQSYVAVTHRVKEASFDAVSFVSGFRDVGGARVYATVDKEQFDLLPHGEAAFIRSGKPEQDLIRAMKRGSSMTVTWITPKGTKIVDKYSLMGFTSTYSTINSGCGHQGVR